MFSLPQGYRQQYNFLLPKPLSLRALLTATLLITKIITWTKGKEDAVRLSSELCFEVENIISQ